MSKRFPTYLLALCLTPAAFAPAFAGGSADTQSLIAVEQQWIHAISARDRATLARILADDFTDVSWRGKIRTREDLLHNLATPASATQKLKDMKVRVYNHVGIVNGLNVITAKDGAWEVHVRFTDVFVKKDGTWHAVSAQETVVKPTLRK